MPNWCETFATFSHKDEAMMDRLREAVRKERLLEEFVPAPEGSNLYELWGTKGLGDYIVENDYVVMDCAWKAPIPFFHKMIELGFTVDARWIERGAGFAGYFLNGETKEYEFDEYDTMPEKVRELLDDGSDDEGSEDEGSDEE